MVMNDHTSRSGFALAGVLVVMAALLLLGVGALTLARIERFTGRSQADLLRARLAAEAGLEECRAMLESKAANDTYLVIQGSGDDVTLPACFSWAARQWMTRSDSSFIRCSVLHQARKRAGPWTFRIPADHWSNHFRIEPCRGRNWRRRIGTMSFRRTAGKSRDMCSGLRTCKADLMRSVRETWMDRATSTSGSPHPFPQQAPIPMPMKMRH